MFKNEIAVRSISAQKEHVTCLKSKYILYLQVRVLMALEENHI